MPRHFLVLGAGISGLATAWFLKKQLNADDQITIVDQRSTVGGWIETQWCDGFLFEQGPRSFRLSNSSQALFEIIEALDLQNQIIFPSKAAQRRYLFLNGRLKVLPMHLWQIPFFYSTRGWLQAVLCDWMAKRRECEDESVASFFTRHCGKEWLEKIIDPMISGIYAGDTQSLSLKSCFPELQKWEQQSGSLIKGMWQNKKSQISLPPLPKKFAKSSLFSFAGGMQTLPNAIGAHFSNSLHLGCTVQALHAHADHMVVQLSNGHRIQADHVISTIPLPALHKIISTLPAFNLRFASVVVVNIGFKSKIADLNGFGYLVPSKANTPVLGCVWDSAIFEHKDCMSPNVRLGMMLGGMHHQDAIHMSEQALESIVQNALKEHMGIYQTPDIIQIHRAKDAIAQFEVGYAKNKEDFLAATKNLFPRLTVSGSSISGVAIGDCIAHAKQIAKECAC